MSILSQLKVSVLLLVVIISGGFATSAQAGEPGSRATIAIPSLGINARIMEIPLTPTGWDTSPLGNRVAHLGGTPWLGESGNIVAGGHFALNSRSSVFSNLSSIQIGARITLTDGDLTQEYEVIETRIVDVTDISVINPTSDNRLTLLTCYNYDAQLRQYTQRFAVIAVPVQ